MTPGRFEALAARFERFSRAQPALYRATVGAMGLLGLGFVAFWLLLALGLLALLGLGLIGRPNLLLVKLAIPVGLFSWALLRATWIRFERPEGIPLTRAEAPAVWAELDRLRALGRLPRIHRVLVDDRLNAAMAQTPRLGLLGFPHNDVVLGLPLLAALGHEPFRAVLAHELGHLSGQHGRMGAWSYRVRATLGRALAILEARRSRLAGVFRAFLGWYGPRFQAASLALARQQELEADRFSAAATSPRVAADALAASAIAGWAFDERYGPMLTRRPALEPEPPVGHLSWMGETLRAAVADADAPAVLERALKLRAAAGDTHPALAERLAALRQAPRVPPRPVRSAAETLLGASLPRLQAELEARWRASVSAAWGRAHEEGQRDAATLAGLEARAAAEALEAGEAAERISLVARLRGPDEALPLAQEAALVHPDHAGVRFLLGRLLLRRQDAAGLPHLERAMALDPEATFACAHLIASFHLAEGRRDLAAPWIERAHALETLGAAAEAERTHVTAADPVEQHGLSAEDVELVAAGLRGHPRVGKAWLGRKRLRHHPERAPVFVVGVVRRGTWYRLEGSGAARKTARELAERIDYPRVFVFVDGPETRAMIRKLRKVGERIV